MKEIKNIFPALNDQQTKQFEALYELYKEWNSKINVISRKDIDNLYLHHVLHSLAIARYITFAPGTTIMDVGTGGGFPGIPLAIFFPESRFLLLDNIGKKIRVVREVADAIGLTNVEAIHSRAEEEKRQYHFVVSRAVMPLPELIHIICRGASGRNTDLASRWWALNRPDGSTKLSLTKIFRLGPRKDR